MARDFFSERRSATGVALFPYVCQGNSIIDDGFAKTMTFIVNWALMKFARLRVVSPEAMAEITRSPEDRYWLTTTANLDYLIFGNIHLNDGLLSFTHSILDISTGAERAILPVKLPVDRLIDIQSAVVPELISQLMPDITELLVQRALQRSSDTLEAVDWMVRAILAIKRLTRGSLDEAEANLKQALAIDPRFATAMAWLARVHNLRAGQGWTENKEETAARALACAQRAVELEPTNALALAIYGHIISYSTGNFEEALELFSKAMAEGPNESQAWVLSGMTLAYVGKAEEGLKRVKVGMALSPRANLAFLYHAFAAGCAYAAERYEEAIELANHAMAENSSYSATLRDLAGAHAALGDLSTARRFGSQLIAAQPEYRWNYGKLIRFADKVTRERCFKHLIAAGVLPPDARP